jgi:alpha-D-ribose 1-methylphosphonate 5-triphosphate synthase subunit PhnG
VEQVRRFEAIALARPGELTPLANTVLADVEPAIVRGPQTGMLMLQACDSAEGIRFNVGEVLVTEALVAIGPHHGYAMIQGLDREGALAGAILDAAVEAGHPETPRILALLERLEQRSYFDRQHAWVRVAPTRVVFDEM